MDGKRPVRKDVPLTLSEVLSQEHAALTGGPCPSGSLRAAAGTKRMHEQPVKGEHEKLAELYRQIHKDEKPRTALCLSGGGIRSASFGLGVIQALAKHELLPHVDYLSTVSGGGYIGSWLSAWVHRHPQGLRGVCDELDTGCRQAGGADPAPVQHLREYSSYLTPRRGVFSLDGWTLIATYLRNLLLSWVVFVPLLLAVVALPLVFESILAVGAKQQTWPRNVGLGLALIGIVAAVLCLLSLDKPKRGKPPTTSVVAGTTAARWGRPPTAAVAWAVVVPITFSAVFFTVAMEWDRASGKGRPELDLTSLVEKVVGIYAVAALVAWAIAR